MPWDRTIIYETHVRGFTKLHPAVPEALRGTFAGLATHEVIDYVKSLGVTTVELLPDPHVHQRQPSARARPHQLLGLQQHRLLRRRSALRRGPEQRLREFKEMVARFHDAGLEVILDVVYNHTAEGNERGPTLSFKGIDNASYYRLLPDQKRYYINDTGTGNTLNLSHPRVIQMVTDSLRYWVQETHVDGFRFDLGTILAREPNGFDNQSGFLKACSQDPVLRTVKLIAEPWDCGPGRLPGRRVSAGLGRVERSSFATRCATSGAAKLPQRRWRRGCAARPMCSTSFGRKPWASVNFVTAHDGFTLNDLVSYNEKHNEANGEDNSDGSSDNRSWNCGAEGPTDDAGINALRQRQMRNLLATLLLSQGTPMLLAGDEFARTQQGNNNAYCQDNEISWVNWELDERGPVADAASCSKLTALRRKYPILRRNRFLTGEYERGARHQGGHLDQRQRRRDAARSSGPTSACAASACCWTAARSPPASASAARTRRC